MTTIFLGENGQDGNVKDEREFVDAAATVFLGQLFSGAYLCLLCLNAYLFVGYSAGQETVRRKMHAFLNDSLNYAFQVEHCIDEPSPCDAQVPGDPAPCSRGD